MSNEDYMREALTLAKECPVTGDVPVGCVVVSPVGEIIGRGRNRREELGSATRHAEVEAIRMACKTVGSWRLHKARLYVTLEPCTMCAGALAWAQLGALVVGASDPHRGYSRLEPGVLHPRTEVVTGVLAEECGELVRDFFAKKRGK